MREGGSGSGGREGRLRKGTLLIARPRHCLIDTPG